MYPEEESFENLSNLTPFAGDQTAAYEEAFDDPMAEQIPDEQQFAKDPRFHHNLASYIGDMDLNTIGNELSEQISKDMSDRDNWIKIINDGIDYLGIGGQRTKTSNATRNTDIYSSTLLTIALRVTSKIHSSFFPAKDFVDIEIKGIQTDEMLDRGYRIKEFFNYFLKDVAEEYIPDKKQAIFWMVLTGSVFSKIYYDRMKERPVAPYVRPEDIIINSGASSLNDAERITHEFTISDREYNQRVDAGEYRQAVLDQSDVYDNRIRQKIDSKIGINNVPDDRMKVYTLHETLVWLDIKGFEHLKEDGSPSGKPLPYIVTKDKNTNTIISIYRNWNEEDPKFKFKNYYVQHKYFTGFNIYGLGLFHLLLGYAKAETELQQQLLKAAQLANAPVLLHASGLRQERSQIDIKPGSINRFDTFGQNIDSSIRPLGFHDPSPIMLELKKMLSAGMEEVSIARQINPENIPQNTSATAMLGVLSTMHILEDSLMNDLYTSFKNELKLLYNLFGQWLPDEPYPFAVEGGEHAVMRQDFMPAIAIRPTLDPNASSTTFQLMINDTINTMALQVPDLYDIKEIHKRMFRAMKVNDVDKLFKQQEPPPEPPALDPISESKQALMDQPIKAYKFQDQAAYIVVHQSTLAQLQADQSQDHSKAIAILMSNIQERQAMSYMADMEAKIGQPIPDDPSQMPPQMQNHIAMVAAKKLQEEHAEELKRNPPPIDPSEVMREEIRVKEMGIQSQTQINAQKVELEQAKLIEEMKIQQMKMQIELERVQLEREKLQAEQQIKFAQLEVEKMKNDLQVQGKAFETTLKFEKDIKPAEEISHDTLIPTE